RLICELVNSETYQLAGTGPNTEALPRWFEQARVRPLSVEELLASIRQATGYDNGKKPGEARLPGAMEEYMLRFFGRATDGRGGRGGRGVWGEGGGAPVPEQRGPAAADDPAAQGQPRRLASEVESPAGRACRASVPVGAEPTAAARGAQALRRVPDRGRPDD